MKGSVCSDTQTQLQIRIYKIRLSAQILSQGR